MKPVVSENVSYGDCCVHLFGCSIALAKEKVQKTGSESCEFSICNQSIKFLSHIQIKYTLFNKWRFFTIDDYIFFVYAVQECAPTNMCIDWEWNWSCYSWAHLFEFYLVQSQINPCRIMIWSRSHHLLKTLPEQMTWFFSDRIKTCQVLEIC